MTNFLLDKMNLFRRQKPLLYRGVVATYLTPEELRTSGLPDDSLYSAWVEFTSAIGQYYQAVHVRATPFDKRPYILLSGNRPYILLPPDEADFSYIGGLVAKVTGGRPEKHVATRGDDRRGWNIRDVINLSGRLTQSRVADFVVEYRRHFNDVEILTVHFDNVSKSAYENSGLPLQNLTVRQ